MCLLLCIANRGSGTTRVSLASTHTDPSALERLHRCHPAIACQTCLGTSMLQRVTHGVFACVCVWGGGCVSGGSAVLNDRLQLVSVVHATDTSTNESLFKLSAVQLQSPLFKVATKPPHNQDYDWVHTQEPSTTDLHSLSSPIL
eukprot:6270477-Amphidinium_carterae.1